MEKCTFCVQRIAGGAPAGEGRGAPDPRRRGADGLRADLPDRAPSTFGNLRDPASGVSQARPRAKRGYHALHVLNTRPAVTYLAKVAARDRREEADDAAARRMPVAAMIRPAPRPRGLEDQPRPAVGDGGRLARLLRCCSASRCGFVLARRRLWIYQVYKGLGIAGYTHPVFWGAYIVTFVFWVGIAHAGTLISAILYLFRAKWRNAINRSAEAMTVFAVLTAAQFLGIHVGRIWKSYFILPYPNQRGLWVNFKSPLLWDTFAISTYATISIVFLYVGLIPDLAIARDRATRLAQAALHACSRSAGRAPSRAVEVAQPHACCTSRGSRRRWCSRCTASCPGTSPMSIVPGWHATIFAPYFVAGAIFSGFAMVLTMMIPVRRIYGLEDVHHRLPLREHGALPAAHVADRRLRLRRRVLHRLVQRRRVRADRRSGCAPSGPTGSRPGP